MASLIDSLNDEKIWREFCSYRALLINRRGEEKQLKEFIESLGYREVYERIVSGGEFPLARRSVISKMSTQKKRAVYTFPYAENMCLKLLDHLMLRKYDGLFCGGLYSFRPGRTAKDAIRTLTRTPGINEMYAYKADVSDYFNSIPAERILPMLKEALYDDKRLYALIEGILSQRQVISGDGIITERKGIMAGVPLSAFLADLYLKDMDSLFFDRGIPYARYSDDIIVFAKSEREALALGDEIKRQLELSGLSINERKEQLTSPEEGWSFLGFYYKEGVTDIAPATAQKLKAKMRRKARALRRWCERNGIQGERGAAAFIRIFNSKLLNTPEGSELSWSRWFFPVINTSNTLHDIDAYAQDCIRYIYTGKRTKGRFGASYEDIKALGYRSLVNEYYRQRREAAGEQMHKKQGENL